MSHKAILEVSAIVIVSDMFVYKHIISRSGNARHAYARPNLMCISAVSVLDLGSSGTGQPSAYSKHLADHDFSLCAAQMSDARALSWCFACSSCVRAWQASHG